MPSNIDYAKATGNGIDFDHPAAAHLKIIDADQGLLDFQGRRKLAIVGFAGSTRDLAPFDDPAWIICGLNQLYRHIPRADMWCDVHVNWNEDNVEGTDHAAWIAGARIPVLMCERHPEFPTSVRFPLTQIVEKLEAKYFTSTIAYLIAYAIWAGFEELGIWGVDLVVGTEYQDQKACAEFWIGYAAGRGMAVRLPDASALLKSTHLYGYSLGPEFAGPLTVKHFESKMKEMGEQREQKLRELYTLDGALQISAFFRELLTLRGRGADIKLA